MNSKVKFFDDMSAEEQLVWVNEFCSFANQTLPALQQRAGKFSADDVNQMKRFMRLLAVWPFASDYAAEAIRYGDYASRFYRFPFYVSLIKKRLGERLSVTEKEGKRYAIVDPTVPVRRRGRPTKEQVAARRQGEEVTPDDPGMEQQRRIAEMLGLDVVVSNNHPREKNNAELAEERTKRQEAFDRQNPNLFDGDPPRPSLTQKTHPDPPCAGRGNEAQGAGSVAQEPQYRLTIAQKRIFLSDELARRSETIRELRGKMSAAAERAKTLADLHRPKKEIAEAAQESADALDALQYIYADIDRYLAAIFYRLQHDGPYRERFCQKYGYTDGNINDHLLHDLRLHYKKVQTAAFDKQMAAIVERESPEYAAKVQADKERRDEQAAIIKYLRRQDKPNTLVRLNTMRERYQRLVELMGEEEAKPYLTFVRKAEEDYNANFRADDEAKAAKASEVKPKKSKTAKATKAAKPKPTKAKATKAAKAKAAKEHE